ncbi:hypothetical protein DFJ73DRAFT_487690 [Zopfochytrium polystomum]|nr:hypothetical protein DFJ73DRAFT_487690 [Zopfochytrium polystomum]
MVTRSGPSLSSATCVAGGPITASTTTPSTCAVNHHASPPTAAAETCATHLRTPNSKLQRDSSKARAGLRHTTITSHKHLARSHQSRHTHHHRHQHRHHYQRHHHRPCTNPTLPLPTATAALRPASTTAGDRSASRASSSGTAAVPSASTDDGKPAAGCAASRGGGTPTKAGSRDAGSAGQTRTCRHRRRRHRCRRRLRRLWRLGSTVSGGGGGAMPTTTATAPAPPPSKRGPSVFSVEALCGLPVHAQRTPAEPLGGLRSPESTPGSTRRSVSGSPTPEVEQHALSA